MSAPAKFFAAAMAAILLAGVAADNGLARTSVACCVIAFLCLVTAGASTGPLFRENPHD